MIRNVLLAAAAVAIAGAAQAQSTNCTERVLGQPQLGMTCETHQPPQTIDPKTVTPKVCTFAERNVLNVPPEICEARAVAANRKAIGELIAGGKCDAAIKAALATGDLEYATQVRTFCAAPAKP